MSSLQLVIVKSCQKMDASPEMLELLICSACQAPLSCAPVHVTLRGDASCGRCGPPKEPAVRSTHYEMTARLLRFPCRFVKDGCMQTLGFSDTEHRHEMVCEYQKFECPESKFKVCDWAGQRTHLLEHYNLKHHNKIHQNPCTLPLDISQPSTDIFLLLAYKVFFLLHTKVCISTKKVQISIQFLGDPEMVSSFKYTLEFLKHEFVISKPGFVISKNTEPLEEDSSVVTTISSLSEVMGDTNGITMTITVRNYLNEMGIRPVSPNYLKCSNWRFDSELTKFEPRLCKNQSKGCKYIDIDKKCEKHERYFCQFNQNCPLCSEEIPNMTTVEQHWELMHADVMYHTGQVWSVRLPEWQVQYCVLYCRALQQTLLCRYKLCWAQFSLALLTPLASEELKTLRCVLHINTPTGEQETFTPEIVLDETHDWSIALKLGNRDISEVQVQIDLVKIDADDEVFDEQGEEF